MTDLVPADQIEQIVGIQRHPYRHYARAVTAEQTVYILHSQACRDHTPDLRTCIYSRALDRGIDAVSDEWEGYHDSPQRVALYDGWLVPWAWLDWPVPARWPADCPECGQPWQAGTPIVRDGGRWVHHQCPPREDTES